MTAAEFTDFLIAETIAAGTTTFVDGILAAAKAKISGGGGQIAPFKIGSIAGRNFEREIRMDAVMVAACCRAALDYWEENGDGVSGTTYDFSEVGGWN